MTNPLSYDTKNSPDHLYYNIKVANHQDTSIQATYSETRLSPFISDNLSKYEVAVVRFKIPNNVPIFVLIPNTLQVTLTSGGVDYSQYLTWIPNTTDPTYFNFVWTYQEFAQMVTNAFALAFASIPGGGSKPANAPFMLYDPNNTRFSIYANNTDYYSVNAMGTKIYMNAPLFLKIQSLYVLYGATGTPKYANILIRPSGSNLITAGPTTELNTSPATPAVVYLKIEQELNSLFLVSDFDTILLRTAHLPVLYEQDSTEGVSGDKFTSIMTDFEPILNNSFNDSSYFQYNPAVYRWTSLYGNSGLNTMDVQLYYRTVNGTVYPINILYGQEFTIKLAFRKKANLIHKE